MTRQIIYLAHAHDIDFKFFRDVAENPNTPKFAGYTTNFERNEGYSPKPKKRCIPSFG